MSKLPRKLVRMMPIAAVLSFLLAAPQPSPAITWCHDYVYNVISGGQDVNGLGPNGDPKSTDPVHKNGLRGELAARGYVQVAGVLFHFTGQASDSKFLRDGDVLLFGDAHSGVVVDETGLINHFLQKWNHAGVPYTIEQAQTAYDDVLKDYLLRRQWKLQDIRDYQVHVPGLTPPLPPYKNVTIQVWRPNGAQLITDWARNTEKRIGAPIAGTFAEYGPGLDADFALSYMAFHFSAGRQILLFMATSRTNPSLRFVTFQDPDNGQWTNWSAAYGLHWLW